MLTSGADEIGRRVEPAGQIRQTTLLNRPTQTPHCLDVPTVDPASSGEGV